MGDFGKKKKSDDLINTAMDDLAGESLLRFDDEQESSMGILGEGIGTPESEEFADDAGGSLELDGEAPSGLNFGDFVSQPQQPIEINESYSEPDLKTAILNSKDEESVSSSASFSGESTVVVNPSSSRHRENSEVAETQDVFGVANPFSAVPAVLSSSLSENQIIQAENLKLAQNRISELEKELESLRAENETMSSSVSFARDQMNELNEKLQKIESDRSALTQQYQSEIAIYKDTVSGKDFELNKLRQKVAELDGRLQKDLRKIRVRERELENRLELLKLEKDALFRSKDETILDLKSKVDQLTHDSNRYQQQVNELNQKLNERHQQMTRTARSLRLALTSLEVNDSSDSANVTPIKKAE